jgi:hypothetical protein
VAKFAHQADVVKNSDVMRGAHSPNRHVLKEMLVKILYVPAPLEIEHAGNDGGQIVLRRHAGGSRLGLKDGGVLL